MTRVSDYVFYRIFNFFKSRGDKVPRTSALVVLSLIEFCTLLDVLIVAQVIFDFSYPPNKYALMVMIILLGLNLKMYQSESAIEKIRNRLGQEGVRMSNRNGWLIAIYMVVSIFGGLVYRVSTA